MNRLCLVGLLGNAVLPNWNNLVSGFSFLRCVSAKDSSLPETTKPTEISSLVIRCLCWRSPHHLPELSCCLGSLTESAFSLVAGELSPLCLAAVSCSPVSSSPTWSMVDNEVGTLCSGLTAGRWLSQLPSDPKSAMSVGVNGNLGHSHCSFAPPWHHHGKCGKVCGLLWWALLSRHDGSGTAPLCFLFSIL